MSKQTDLLNLTDAITVDSSNNVGIGTSSPTAALDVRRVDADGAIAEFHQSTGYGFKLSSSQSVASIESGYLQDFVFKTGTTATERMRIDTSGRVTMPYQPAFKVGMNANTFNSGASSTQINYDYVMFDRTNSYSTSTGRYTCPVGGLYLFTHNVSSRTAYTGSYEVKIFQNGVERQRQFVSSSGSDGTNSTAELLCNANDYIEARGYWAGGITLSGNLDLTSSDPSQGCLSYFSGHLIG